MSTLLQIYQNNIIVFYFDNKNQFNDVKDFMFSERARVSWQGKSDEPCLMMVSLQDTTSSNFEQHPDYLDILSKPCNHAHGTLLDFFVRVNKLVGWIEDYIPSANLSGTVHSVFNKAYPVSTFNFEAPLQFFVMADAEEKLNLKAALKFLYYIAEIDKRFRIKYKDYVDISTVLSEDYLTALFSYSNPVIEEVDEVYKDYKDVLDSLWSGIDTGVNNLDKFIDRMTEVLVDLMFNHAPLTSTMHRAALNCETSAKFYSILNLVFDDDFTKGLVFNPEIVPLKFAEDFEEYNEASEILSLNAPEPYKDFAARILYGVWFAVDFKTSHTDDNLYIVRSNFDLRTIFECDADNLVLSPLHMKPEVFNILKPYFKYSFIYSMLKRKDTLFIHHGYNLRYDNLDISKVDATLCNNNQEVLLTYCFYYDSGDRHE